MLHALTLLLATADVEDEPSKTAFYVCGGLLTAWAILLGAVGMSRVATFPSSGAAARGVMALSAVLVVAAMATAVITA